MSERTSGIYRLVTHPLLYRGFQNLLGARHARRIVEARFLADFAGQDVLEVGCGPGEWAPHMAGCRSYLGLDWNPAHIAAARDRVRDARFAFEVADIRDRSVLAKQGYDRVFAFGILHHLDDAEVRALVQALRDLMRPGGRLVIGEPVFHEGQGRLARFMKRRDSGQHIRTQAGYRHLLDPVFGEVLCEVQTDLLRIPYSHAIFQCRP